MDRTHPQPAPGGPSRVLALGLLSGGLDSALAAALLLEQGLEVVGLHLESPVSCRGDARGLAAELGIPLIVRAKGEEFLQLLRRPRWGYGRHLNPCLDCRVLMLRRAGEVMRETGAGFVFTGEVPGQRPMSQLRDRMRLVDRQSGLEGLVLRPLSARLLPETEPERRGWVDRTRLLAVSGRSRRVQLAEEDAAAAEGTLDFLGVNYYARDRYRRARLQPFTHAREVVDPAAARNPLGWEIYPDGLHRHLGRLREEYGNPEVVITENGYPTIETAGQDPLDDPDRITYLRDHAAAVGRAIAEGSRCTGFFCWTLTDNFEWSNGYRARFGLVRVDFATQERRCRASARWYRDLIAANAVSV